jgi:hypothetical protein
MSEDQKLKLSPDERNAYQAMNDEEKKIYLELSLFKRSDYLNMSKSDRKIYSKMSADDRATYLNLPSLGREAYNNMSENQRTEYRNYNTRNKIVIVLYIISIILMIIGIYIDNFTTIAIASVLMTIFSLYIIYIFIFPYDDKSELGFFFKMQNA